MFGLPKTVLSLSNTEMWERFSFYTMQSILVLFASAPLAKHGMGWSDQNAIFISGFYGAAVFATPILGGWIADNWLSAKKSVALGGILMCLGHFILAIPNLIAFFIALTMLIVGCGFLKPCISSMVGECYDEGDNSRDSGFAFFYMTINIGGFFGPMMGGWVSEHYSYNLAFIFAGIGLIVGLTQYAYACKTTIHHIGNHTNRAKKKSAKTKKPLSLLEKRKLAVLIVLSVTNIAWSVVYALPYGILTLYADRNINNNWFGFKIASTWYYGAYSLYIVILTPILSKVYSYCERKKINFTLSNKLGWGYLTLGLGSLALIPTIAAIVHNPKAVVQPWGLIIFYIIFALSELLVNPVLLSAATRLSPPHLVSTMVAFFMLVSWCLGQMIGSWVSGWSLTHSFNPLDLFISIVGLSFVLGIVHFLVNKLIESMCADPAAEIKPH